MLVILLACVLVHSAILTRAGGGTRVPITLYTDNACNTPSTTAANVSLEIGVCAVTPGLGSFHLQPYPCSSGSVANYVFSDTACGQVADDSYYRGGDDGRCYAAYKGGMAAVMLSCDPTNSGQPASTTTINVGPIATGGASTTSPASSTSATAGSSGGDGSSSNFSPVASGWNSLDLSARIGIIVALSVGIPPILLAVYMIRQKKKELGQAYEEAHGTPMPTYPYFRGGSNEAFQPGLRPSQSEPMGQPMSLEQKWAGYNFMTRGGGGS